MQIGFDIRTAKYQLWNWKAEIFLCILFENKIYIPSTIQYFQNLFAESTFCFLNYIYKEKYIVHFFHRPSKCSCSEMLKPATQPLCLPSSHASSVPSDIIPNNLQIRLILALTSKM